MTTLLFNVVMLFLVLSCMAAIISPRVETGIIGTLGLTCISISALTACDSQSRANPDHVILSMALGCLLVATGILVQYWRIHKTIPADRRRRTADQLRAVRTSNPDRTA